MLSQAVLQEVSKGKHMKITAAFVAPILFMPTKISEVPPPFHAELHKIIQTSKSNIFIQQSDLAVICVM